MKKKIQNVNVNEGTLKKKAAEANRTTIRKLKLEDKNYKQTKESDDERVAILTLYLQNLSYNETSLQIGRSRNFVRRIVLETIYNSSGFEKEVIACKRRASMNILETLVEEGDKYTEILQITLDRLLSAVKDDKRPLTIPTMLLLLEKIYNLYFKFEEFLLKKDQLMLNQQIVEKVESVDWSQFEKAELLSLAGVEVIEPNNENKEVTKFADLGKYRKINKKNASQMN